MKKKRKKRKRLTSRARKRKQQRVLKTRAKISLEIEALEVASGHDGLWRGTPEPVVVCALFALQNNTPRLIGRGIGRFPNPDTYPCTIRLLEPTLVRGQLDAKTQHSFCVLVLALEEDGGKDIQRAYALLENHQDLLFLETKSEPDAVDLAEVLQAPQRWERPHAVELQVDGHAFASSCNSDKWISASLFTGSTQADTRVHLQSAQKRNDWTAIIKVS